MKGVVSGEGSEDLEPVLLSVHYSKPRKPSLLFHEVLLYFSFTDTIVGFYLSHVVESGHCYQLPSLYVHYSIR